MANVCRGALARFPNGLGARLLVETHGTTISVGSPGLWPGWFLKRVWTEWKNIFNPAIQHVKERQKPLDQASATTVTVFQIEAETSTVEVRIRLRQNAILVRFLNLYLVIDLHRRRRQDLRRR
jgi:hypothetical protein